TGCAVVLVRHLKASARVALLRGVGSVGIIAAARNGLLVAPDPADPSHRVQACAKIILAERPPSLRFRLRAAAGGACKVGWRGGFLVAAGTTARASSRTGARATGRAPRKRRERL